MFTKDEAILLFMFVAKLILWYPYFYQLIVTDMIILLTPQKFVLWECNTILTRITMAYIYFLFPIRIHKSHTTFKINSIWLICKS